MYKIVPVSLKEAKDFVDQHHRHNKGSHAHKFSVGLERDGELIGVATCGRPISRNQDDGRTLEVSRVCVMDEYRNANSMLYGACCRAAKAMGYTRMITYTLMEEAGASLKAAGFVMDGTTDAHKKGWNSETRKRIEIEISKM